MANSTNMTNLAYTANTTNMYLEIKPKMCLRDLDNYAAFSMTLNRRRTSTMEKLSQDGAVTCATKSLMSIPSGFNCWKTNDGQFLQLDIRDYGQFQQQHIRWLMFSIYHYFRPLNYVIEGCLHGCIGTDKEWKLTCENNIISVDVRYRSGQSGNFVNNNFAWDPASGDREIERLLLNAMGKVFAKSGLKEWSIVQSHNSESHISPTKRRIYLSYQHLLLYCKRYGIRQFVLMIKKRISQLTSGMFDRLTISQPSFNYPSYKHADCRYYRC